MANFPEIEKKIGYNFVNKTLLKHAIISLKGDNLLKSFERLEFLGDRVLGLVIAEHLLNTFQAENEGDIAKRHAALVCQDALVKIAEKIELPQILTIKKEDIQARYNSYFSDMIESIIGAIYLDSDIKTAASFILEHWKDLCLESNQSPPPSDPKTTLQEWVQSHSMPLPEYQLIETSGPDHEPTFCVQVNIEHYPPAKGKGRSKKQAEQDAASNFLNKIKL